MRVQTTPKESENTKVPLLKSVFISPDRILTLIILSSSSFNAAAQCAYTGSPPRAVSKQLAEVRVLVQNAFGLDEDGDAQCKARGQALGNRIANANPAFDIIALQEHWESFDAGIKDCDPKHLTNAIWSTGRYKKDENYYRHRPRGERRQLEADGALSIFTEHAIEKFAENEWDDIPRDGPFKVLHGSTFSRIKLKDRGIKLDVYNVHVLAQEADDCDLACRQEELHELRAEIVHNSSNSGNPVIVMGDFNIGGPPSCNGNAGYADIMSILENPRDLWLESHPGESGYTIDCLRNSLTRSTSSGGSCQTLERIDYMFLIESPRLTNSRFEVVVSQPDDTRLAEFQTNSGVPVSDHFGIEATLEIRRRGIRDTPVTGLAGKCMTVRRGVSRDGTPIELSDCNRTTSQRWTVDHLGQLRGLAGKCLTVRNGSTTNRTPTELRRCTGAANQRFDFTFAGELRSRMNARKCVEVRGGFTSNGTAIQLYDCNGTASQRWQDEFPTNNNGPAGGQPPDEELPICIRQPQLPMCNLDIKPRPF